MDKRAVFLDRDGVIDGYVHNPEFGTVDTPANPDEFELLPGVADAILALNELDLAVVVVSNQPGIAKGKFSSQVLDAITAKMRSQLALSGARLDAIFYCRHHPQAVVPEYRAVCDCRKPEPGLLLRAGKEFGLNLKSSFMIGDDVPDILAGRAARTTTVLISSHRCTLCEQFSARGAYPDHVVANLGEASTLITRLLDAPQSRRFHSDPMAATETKPCILASHEHTYASKFLSETAAIAATVDPRGIEELATLLSSVRARGGRLFFLGVGGGAGHASHATCDFRKIGKFEAYAVTDNVSELTARINDDGWDTSYRNWLVGSRLNQNDMVFVFSVGGGDAEKNISTSLVRALQYAREIGCSVGGVVGPTGGYTAQVADACVRIPVVNHGAMTAHTEAFQAVVWHLLVSHPALKLSEMKWESVSAQANAGSAASLGVSKDMRTASVG